MTSTSAEVQIALLGDFSVRIGGRTVPAAAWPTRRAAELVQLLAISEGRQLLRDQVVEALWPHLDATAGAANLRKAAHLARQATGEVDAVVLRLGCVELFPEHTVVVDAEDFEQAAREALARGDAAACDAALSRWSGELLPTARYEDWAEPVRRRLNATRLDCLRAAGRWAEVVEADPLDEAAYRELMRAALRAGSRAAAVRWYGRLRRALFSELGVAPGQETEALYLECVASAAGPETGLVGREQELAQLDALVPADRPAGGGGVALRGPAGIGKTALCRAFAEREAARGAAVVTVDCEASLAPYGPVADLVTALLDENVAARLPEHTAGVLAALAPETGLVAPRGGPLTRHQIIGALRRLVLAVGEGRRVLVVADDLHAADDASVEALLNLATPRDPITLLLSLRDRPCPATLDAHLNRLVRAHRLRLMEVGPLAVDDAAELARSVAGRPLEDTAARSIAELAAGNPFAVIELARSGDPAPDGRLPADVGRALVGRLVDLPDEAVALLERLAVLGEHVDPTEAVALTDGDETEACRLLDAALEAGVLVVSGDRYRFRHDLVRRALGEQVPPHERQAVHREAARRLRSVGGPAAEEARHWLAGGRPLEAVEPLLRVARQSLELGAFSVAIDALDRVLVAAPDHAAALRWRAEALDALGDVGAVPAYDAAIAQADPTERDDLRAKRALAQLKQGDPPGALRALAGVRPSSVDARLAEALTYSGAAALGFIPPETGTAKSAECRRLALEAGDAQAIVVASWAGAAAAHARGELRESVLADLRDTSEVPVLATRVFDGQLCVTQRLLYGSRPYDDVIAFADSLAAEAHRLGAARGHAFGVILRGEAELLSGRLDDAERDLTRARRLHHAIGGATGEAHALQRLAELALCRGDAVAAGALLDEALDLARATDLGFHLFDRIYGTRLALAQFEGDQLGTLDEAEMAVRGGLETCPGCRITFAVPAAIAAAQAGDVARAGGYAQAVEFLAGVVMRLPAWDAAHHEVLGHLHRAAGDEEAATRELRVAAAGFARAEQPLDELRCLAALTR